MTASERLEHYLAGARRRLAGAAWARALAAAALLALVFTCVAVWSLGRAGFAPTWVRVARALLVLVVVGSAAALLWRPLRVLRQREGAGALERSLPDQDGRIATWLHARRAVANGQPSPLLDLLAEDADQIAQRSPLSMVLPAHRTWMPAAIAIASVGFLIALALFGGAFWGGGTRSLWLGQPLSAAALATVDTIVVLPGDASVRRNQDLAIQAKVAGRQVTGATLHVRYADDGEWEEAPMTGGESGQFGATLYALRETASYYVTAGSARSREHRITLVELPKLESLRLTYDYPAWTGLKPRTDEEGGDIRAVAGTQVTVDVKTDAPLEGAQLVVNEVGSPLTTTGVAGKGSLRVGEEGQYRISARIGDELVPLTDNFRISVVADEKPTVSILKPGRDYQASAIEEVPVQVRAQDDFRLESLQLRYSVNGGEWRSEALDAAASDINTAALLRLEEMTQKQGEAGAAPLVPGDLVSYYAVARDHRNTVQTDLFLVQIQPFDRRYTQSQSGGGGGGGGGGGDDDAIAQRQREILLATWNLTRSEERGDRDKERLADSARMLSDLQKTLAEQAQTLVERANARLLTDSNENIRSFVKSLEQAAQAMKPASERLSRNELQAAISDEQRALQHLLRAEATFRDIQVAMQQGGGGGGGGGQASRDVAEMTELEMDLEKNQYETESQMNASSASETENEALRKLRELARRQEQLARENARKTETPEAQRWQQEQLRREAEELKRQLEQVAKQQNAQQSGKGSQSSRSAQNSSGGAAGSALEQLQDAIRNMESGQKQPANSQQAGRDLQQAAERLAQGQRQGTAQGFESLAQQAGELLEEQRRTEEELQSALRSARAQPQPAPQPGRDAPRSTAFQGMDYQRAQALAERKRELQSQLETLQSQMQSVRQRNRERTPQAADRVGKAGQELDEMSTAARLARAAQELERGRTTQAASRDGLITESLESLRSQLAEAAQVAGTEVTQQDTKGEAARPGDLVAELAELRRSLEQAQRQQRAQQAQIAQLGGPGSQQERQSQNGEGQQQGQGQQPGQGSPQGQGGQQQGGGGQSAQGLAPGSARGGQFNPGGRGGDGRDLRLADATDLRPQSRASGQRLQDLRGRLQEGALADADVAALKELSERLRRAGGDPMSSEYPRIQALVNQLEIAALRAAREADKQTTTRAAASGNESPRYQDDVAEYFRRLGGQQGR